MPNSSGEFIWYELMTTDADAAATFYGEVVGWAISPQPDPLPTGQDYRMIGRSDGGFAGGVLALTTAMRDGGARPGWLGYLHVDDVDAMVEANEAGGGGVPMPPTDIPQGRIAMITDPQGAPIYVMKPTPPASRPDAQSDVFSYTQAQHVRWNELQSSDPQASVDFYTGHFGWTQDGEMDMGPLGKYRLMSRGGGMIGAIMPKFGAAPHSFWMYYIGVDDIDQAVAAVTAGGGQIHGPINPIPGGEFTVHAGDPQGAHFGLVGPRKA